MADVALETKEPTGEDVGVLPGAVGDDLPVGEALLALGRERPVDGDDIDGVDVNVPEDKSGTDVVPEGDVEPDADAASEPEPEVPASPYAGKSVDELIAELDALKAEKAAAPAAPAVVDVPKADAPAVTQELTPAEREAAEWKDVETWGTDIAQTEYDRSIALERAQAVAEGLDDDEVKARLDERDAALQRKAWEYTRTLYRKNAEQVERAVRTLTEPLVRAQAPAMVERDLTPIVTQSVDAVRAALNVPDGIIDVAGLANAMVAEGLWDQWRGSTPEQRASFVAEVVDRAVMAGLRAGTVTPRVASAAPAAPAKPKVAPQVAPDALDAAPAPAPAVVDAQYIARREKLRKSTGGELSDDELDRILKGE